MPPSLAVPEFGQFTNDVPLTVAEIKTLIHWADTGAQRGDGPAEDSGRDRTTPHFEVWPRRIVLKSETSYDVPTAPGLHRRCLSYSAPVQEPTAVAAINVVPGDERVVYYVRVFAQQNQREDLTDSGYDCGKQLVMPDTRISLGEWSPHRTPEPLPSGTGRLLLPGSTVTVEICYQSIGIKVRDRSRVELLLQPATKFVHTVAVANKLLSIPAGEWDFHAEASWTVDHDVTFLSVSPHMHKLGTEMRVRLTRPDGTSEDMLWIRGYDENRQKAYVFRDPLRVPKGSRVDLIATFDNSESNTSNPNTPPRAVHWGTSERDEMLVAFLEYLDGLQ
jgi:Copper type II ascorbate-dependent monooxygenase, C-terminal domain